jgi:hypothetical protein
MFAIVLAILTSSCSHFREEKCEHGKERMMLIAIQDSLFHEYHVMRFVTQSGAHLRVISMKDGEVKGDDCSDGIGRNLVVGESYCLELLRADKVVFARFIDQYPVRGMPPSEYQCQDTDSSEYRTLWSHDTIVRDMVRFSPNICGLKYVEPGR